MKQHPLNASAQIKQPLLVTTEGQVLSGGNQSESPSRNGSCSIRKQQTSVPRLEKLMSPH